MSGKFSQIKTQKDITNYFGKFKRIKNEKQHRYRFCWLYDRNNRLIINQFHYIRLCAIFIKVEWKTTRQRRFHESEGGSTLPQLPCRYLYFIRIII